jgi:hypothetical protein
MKLTMKEKYYDALYQAARKAKQELSKETL